MPCLTSGLSVVIRAEALDAHYPGGAAAFVISHEHLEACGDGRIVATSLESPVEAWALVESLVADGLLPFRDGWAEDLVVCTPTMGPCTLCDWLEYGRPADALGEEWSSIAIVRRRGAGEGAVAIPRLLMDELRRQQGIGTDPRSPHPDPISIHVSDGPPPPGEAPDGEIRSMLRFESPVTPRRPTTAPGGRVIPPTPAAQIACRDRLDEELFLAADGDPNELRAARAFLRLLEQGDRSLLDAMADRAVCLRTDFLQTTIRGASLVIGYLHARHHLVRRHCASIAAELVAIDDVDPDRPGLVHPRACVRIWCGPLVGCPNDLDDLGMDREAIDVLARAAAHQWMSTFAFGMAGERIASIDGGRHRPPDEPMRKGRWGEQG